MTEIHDALQHRAHYAVPEYNIIVKRNEIEILSNSGDLTLRNGDIALTKWGDFMLSNEDYHAFFKLVDEWRFNYPTLRTMFEAVFDTFQRQRELDETIERAILSAFDSSGLKPDMTTYHRAREEHGAVAVARSTFAGAIVMVISKALLSFRNNVIATEDEWKKSTPLLNGCSVGQILEASANNFRHNDEWEKTRPPTPQQLKSIRVLSAALQEPIFGDGHQHKLARDICPETLQLISDRDFLTLEKMIFSFANNLLSQRKRRLANQLIT